MLFYEEAIIFICKITGNGKRRTKPNCKHNPKQHEKVSEFMKQEGKDSLFLRVYVSGGGCSGLSYGMGFEEKSDEDDYVLEQNG